MFQDLHPGPTAGDGRAVPRRTTYKPGDRQIEIVRCAQCGMLNRVGIESEGETREAPIAQAQSTITVSRSNDTLPQPLKNMTAFQNGATYNKLYDQTLGGGCRFCGSMNWRGTGRSQDPFAHARQSMENR